MKTKDFLDEAYLKERGDDSDPLFMLVFIMATKLDWTFAVDETADTVHGMWIGTEQHVKMLVAKELAFKCICVAYGITGTTFKEVMAEAMNCTEEKRQALEKNFQRQMEK